MVKRSAHHWVSVECDVGKAAMEAVIMQMVRDRAGGSQPQQCAMGEDLLDIPAASARPGDW